MRPQLNGLQILQNTGKFSTKLCWFSVFKKGCPKKNAKIRKSANSFTVFMYTRKNVLLVDSHNIANDDVQWQLFLYCFRKEIGQQKR